MGRRQARQPLTHRRGHRAVHRMPVVSPCILVVVPANRANAAKRLVPCGFAPVRSAANRAQARPIRINRRRCASRKSSRRAYLRGIRRFRMGHCTRGVLPGQNPMRGARARRFDSVRVQTEVCRVCGLHPGQGEALNSPPETEKRSPLFQPVLVRVSGDFRGEKWQIGHREIWSKKRACGVRKPMPVCSQAMR